MLVRVRVQEKSKGTLTWGLKYILLSRGRRCRAIKVMNTRDLSERAVINALTQEKPYIFRYRAMGA